MPSLRLFYRRRVAKGAFHARRLVAEVYSGARQAHPTGDHALDPSKSLPLSPARRGLLDDIITLYELKLMVVFVKRHTRNCVYIGQIMYPNDRHRATG
ncbi:hypothetical protein F5Y05DRAFT_381038 [Hypoxylon sp. FL0543]|nr:hypothetical protein F5Y05DRAFT_381038 [Hypoxylon sp. FL0543]